MTRISVVIPALNDALMLQRALADLAAQTRPADEIVVVDNGSTDDTAEVARAAGARVLSQPLRGIWPAASTGYDAADGDIIARIDADSRPARDWIERIEQQFDSSPAIGVLTGPGDFYGTSRLANWMGEHVYIGGYFGIVGPWLATVPVFGSNFAMRREVWLRTRGRVHRDRADIHDDQDFTIALPLDVIVRYDDELRVGVSARPLQSWSKLRARLRMAWRTFAIWWPDASPWRRRAARRRFDREAMASARTDSRV